MCLCMDAKPLYFFIVTSNRSIIIIHIHFNWLSIEALKGYSYLKTAESSNLCDFRVYVLINFFHHHHHHISLSLCSTRIGQWKLTSTNKRTENVLVQENAQM